MVEILFLLGHGLVVCPRLRDRDHHGQRQRHTAHHQKFQCIVEHRRVGTLCGDNRHNLGQIIAQNLIVHGLLAGSHLIGVAADRIDLTVMYDKTVRMGSFPARCRIGTETGMYHGDRGIIIRALQIIKELSELSYQKHTLVDDGTAGQGQHVGVIVTESKNTASHV